MITSEFTPVNNNGAPQQPFGGNVPILLPLHRSVPCYRRPGPRGRGGDFFALAGATAQGESTQSRRPFMQGIGTRGQRIHGVSREGWVCGGSEAAATNRHVCSSAHNLACFAATPARSSSARRSFHLSTSFA